MVSRRSILRGATALGGFAVTGAVTAAATADASTPGAATADASTPGAATPGVEQVPETLAHRRTGLTNGSQVPTTGFPLTHLGVAWTGPGAAVRLRTRTGWSEWRQVRSCAGGSDTAAPASIALLGATGATGYEVSVGGGGTVSTIEINTVDGPTRTTAAPVAPLVLPGSAGEPGRPVPKLPQYLSRPAWGADESLRLDPDGSLDTPPVFIPVQTLTVHHSGMPEGPDFPAAVRAIYFLQAVTKDWGDIGYQLLIDPDGRVYEGTYSDPDRVPVFGPDPGPGGRPQMVNGSHVGGFNAGNIGVCVLGDYTAQLPTDAARRSLTLVLALLAGATRLDPLGTTDYVNPVNAYRARVATISGHRDWHAANPVAGDTECPGDMFHPQLPELRQDVAELMRRLSPAG